ncbi:hypothetical protein [Ahrensia sp. 13_GOM-1096m]|uniref:hypothetical protein n=1 Tax=Ahrensia sp. 13_GOM-1096m TaxID=1380380 RepID=UPI00047BD80A|nr:hypothetical protein [Ahrensia sp. 13_GOM-1096m]
MFIPLQYHTDTIRYTDTDTETDTIRKLTRETGNRTLEKDTVNSCQAGNLTETYGQNRKAYEDGKSRSPLAPSPEPTAPSLNLMAFWLRHKAQSRPIGEILTDARSGVLSGVVSGALPDQFIVKNQAAVLAAITRGDAHA